MIGKIQYKSGYKYQLDWDYTHYLSFSLPEVKLSHEWLESNGNLLTIKAGYAWDGPSGPAIDTDNFMRGSLVHDALYQLMRDKVIDPKEFKEKADRELQKICLEDGMSSLRAWWVYKGLQIGGWAATQPRENEIKISPK